MTNFIDNHRDSVFKPTGTLAGYHGCVDIAIEEDDVALSNLFEGDHFTDQYLNSFVQQGFSATCLQTVWLNLYMMLKKILFHFMLLKYSGVCQ